MPDLVASVCWVGHHIAVWKSYGGQVRKRIAADNRRRAVLSSSGLQGLSACQPLTQDLEMFSTSTDVYAWCQWECRMSRAYRDAQDRLLWRDETCPARI